MKILIIGGTGTISSAVVREAIKQGHAVTVLNRGQKKRTIPDGVRVLHGDINKPQAMEALLRGEHFDVVAQFVGFTADHVERDLRLFSGKATQYIYISSASAYQKPLSYYKITEDTPLDNIYWDYSQNKQRGEELLQAQAASYGLAYTIVRPSHTYGIERIPVGVYGHNGSYSVVRRIMEGRPVIMHGDGESLWTFTFNEDFAIGFVGLFGHHQAYGQAVHITSDETLSWNTAYRIIGEAVGREVKFIHVASDRLIDLRPDLRGPLLGDKGVSVVFDNSKIKRLVPGFRCETRFDHGVRLALDHIAKHPELQTEDPEFDLWCDRLAEKSLAFGREFDRY